MGRKSQVVQIKKPSTKAAETKETSVSEVSTS